MLFPLKDPDILKCRPAGMRSESHQHGRPAARRSIRPNHEGSRQTPISSDESADLQEPRPTKSPTKNAPDQKYSPATPTPNTLRPRYIEKRQAQATAP